MSEKKKNRAITDPTVLEPMFEHSVVSQNECTGLCPTVPQTEEEAASYRDIAPVFVTSQKKKKKK